jgi:DNA-binding NtrC family response regulator
MILDYRLPGISGLTVLEKTHQIRPNLRTIMISAFGDGPGQGKRIRGLCFFR